MEITVDRERNILKIYRLTKEEYEFIRQIGRWNANQSVYEVKICRSNIKYLLKNPNIANRPEIQEFFIKYRDDAILKSRLHLLEKIPLDFSKYKLHPYRYQQEGVYFIWLSKRGIIGDEPGLGKTMQAIIAADMLYSSGIILVVCPRTLVFNWANEINKVIGYLETDSLLDILNNTPIWVVSGYSYQPIPSNKKWIICGYSQFTPDNAKSVRKTWSSHFLNENIDTLILDEAHRVKNPSANRTRNLRAISRKAKNLILLSGTLMLNNVEELWSPLNMVSPDDFPSKAKFCDEYAKSYPIRVMKRTKSGSLLDLEIKKYYGVKNAEALRKTLAPFMIRRLKKDVIEQLPEKTRVFMPFCLPEEYEKDYDKMYYEFIDYLIHKGELEKAMKASRAEHLVQNTELMKFISNIKAMLCEDTIDELLDIGKLVVFCLYKDTANYLYDKFKDRAFKITGDYNIKYRQGIVDEFKASANNSVLIMTYGAGAEGYNLEVASNMLMVDFNWVPAVMLQAEDRIHRMTSKNNVTIRYAYLEDTIDKVVFNAVKEKLENIGKVMATDQSIIEHFANYLRSSVSRET